MNALGASSNSTGHARGYRGLAAVAVGLLAANATSTAAKIDGLLREGGGRGAKENTVPPVVPGAVRQNCGQGARLRRRG